MASQFDYGLVPSGSRSKVRKATTEIRNAMHNIGTDILTIGAKFIEVKEELPYGQFGAWLQKEFSMTDRTARRYMEAVEKSLKPESAYLQLGEEKTIAKMEPNENKGVIEITSDKMSEVTQPQKAPIRPVSTPHEPIKMRVVPDDTPTPVPVSDSPLPDANIFDEASQLCKELMAAVHALCGNPPNRKPMKCGHYISKCRQELENHVMELRRAFRFERPYAVCPYCAGRDKTCEGCKGTRWVTEQMYESAPPEMRERVKGTVIK